MSGRDHPALGLFGGLPGDRLTIRYAGGGGYGPPDRRDRDRVLSDLRHGYITERAARAVCKLI